MYANIALKFMESRDHAPKTKDCGEVTERETWWLIERPGPTYVTSEGWHPGWSTDPRRAKRFPTARAADDARLSIHVDELRDSSIVVEHMFINKIPKALSHSSTDGHTRFCAIHTVGDCTCSVSSSDTSTVGNGK
jgi:hypothetical protein